jgi:membrane protein involved in colicin uptake
MNPTPTKSNKQNNGLPSQNSLPSVALPIMSNFQNSVGESGQGQSFPQVYLDPETIQQQKESSIAMIESQAVSAKERLKSEFDSQVEAVHIRAAIEEQNATSAIEQAKQHALFMLKQQHDERKLQIQQRSQEQSLQIEATSSQLIMQAQQQKLQREMDKKMAELQAAAAASSQAYAAKPPMFPTSNNLNGGGNTSFANYQFFNPYTYTTSSVNYQSSKPAGN